MAKIEPVNTTKALTVDSSEKAFTLTGANKIITLLALGRQGNPGDQGDPGTNAPKVQIEYSVNGTDNWHSTFTEGDLYMRISTDDGSTWSGVMKFIGADGTDGEIIGPVSSVDGNLASFDGEDGSILQDSGKKPSDFLESVLDDTTPQLGGNLDVNGNKIVSISNGSIEITPNGTGQIKMGKAARFDTLLSNGAASCTIDWRLNNKQLITPDGNRTYAFTGTDGPSSFTLWITVTAARTLTWPASVSWRGGAPDISAAGTFIATFAWNGVDTYIGTCTGKD